MDPEKDDTRVPVGSPDSLWNLCSDSFQMYLAWFHFTIHMNFSYRYIILGIESERVGISFKELND